MLLGLVRGSPASGHHRHKHSGLPALVVSDYAHGFAVDSLYVDPHEGSTRFFMHYGDLTDATNLIRLVQETAP